VKSPDENLDFLVRVGPVRDASGEVVAGISTASDVTASHRDLARLKESEERFRLLAENASDVVLRLSSSGVIEWVSPSLFEITGWQPVDVLGRHMSAFAHPDDELNADDLTALLRSGDLRTGRTRVRMADHSYRWFSRTVRPIHDEFGAVLAFVSSWRDVDSEVQAERRLRESEAQFRQAMETASIGMMMTSGQGVFLSVNPAICTMLGYDRAELEGMTFFDITHPDDISLGAQGIKDLANGVIQTFKQRKRYLTKLGSVVWVDLSTAAMFDSDGVFRHTVTQVVDVTTEVLNYEALQRSARQFRLIAESASDVVYQTDLGGVIEWVSPSVSHVLGWEPDLLVGVRAMTLLHPDDVPSVDALRDRLASGEVLEPVVIRYRTSTGPMREMSVIARQIRASSGEWIGNAVSLRDVTEEQEARRELARSEEQFRLAMANAPHGMVLTDAFGRILQVNNAMADLLGVGQADVLGSQVTEFLTSEARGPYTQDMTELLGRKRDSVRQERQLQSLGRELWVDHATSLQRDELGRPIFFVHQFADQTTARETLARNEWLAHHDELTSLLNRRGGNQLVADALAAVAQGRGSYGLMFIDIDHFKEFNTRGGEEAGDAVLRSVAARLVAAAGQSAEVIRWGGDEFLVLVDLVGESDLHELAHALREEASRPVRDRAFAPDGKANVTVSVIATLIRPDDTTQGLITRVSAPLSEAKEQGRNRVTVQI
jgi:diguanylate cyclase (GGDEF)-like protein/PAS domain S-box-containing protein